MAEMPDLCFLFDVDNTLIENDRITEDLSEYLTTTYGAYAHDCYWAIFEALRRELGYADYLGALERYRVKYLHDPRILRMANWLIDYPFANRLYPGALDAVRHAAKWGTTAILSDGDAVFQPRKVQRSGLSEEFGRRVLIYIHKEQELDYVEKIFPAKHYVLIDDKLRILDMVKKQWGAKVTTVFPRQGHYAHDPEILAAYPPADIAIDRIGALTTLAHEAFAG
ncbi:MAG: HAD family hydrolase [Alphaproteobacteria bacterium]|nr:HAD family hydrolase [Alphaproteobacteria bacterium]MDE2111180.1 HAD family hydrolase [Alphaproteobacteria bacterium]MDE2495998.1 HAD family hydrolase [Alphaproteobacteria bacterium]